MWSTLKEENEHKAELENSFTRMVSTNAFWKCAHKLVRLMPEDNWRFTLSKNRQFESLKWVAL
jgi:hypothetical protein